jgi:hypothetical protein
VRTLDSFGFVPDLIKIDVEGYEHRVLEGATEMLQRAPVILFEALSETARQYCENIILAANPRMDSKRSAGGPITSPGRTGERQRLHRQQEQRERGYC